MSKWMSHGRLCALRTSSDPVVVECAEEIIRLTIRLQALEDKSPCELPPKPHPMKCETPVITPTGEAALRLAEAYLRNPQETVKIEADYLVWLADDIITKGRNVDDLRV